MYKTRIIVAIDLNRISHSVRAVSFYVFGIVGVIITNYNNYNELERRRSERFNVRASELWIV